MKTRSSIVKGRVTLSQSVVCSLCCKQFVCSDLKLKKDNNEINLIRRLCQDILEYSKKESEIGNLEKKLSFCSSCSKMISSAVTTRQDAQKVERKVEKLQREILREMKMLQGKLLGFYGEMRKIEDVIRNTEEAMEMKMEFEDSFVGGEVEQVGVGSRNKEKRKRDQCITSEIEADILEFRQKILSANQDIQKYISAMESKFDLHDANSNNASQQIHTDTELDRDPLTLPSSENETSSSCKKIKIEIVHDDDNDHDPDLDDAESKNCTSTIEEVNVSDHDHDPDFGDEAMDIDEDDHDDEDNTDPGQCEKSRSPLDRKLKISAEEPNKPGSSSSSSNSTGKVERRGSGRPSLDLQGIDLILKKFPVVEEDDAIFIGGIPATVVTSPKLRFLQCSKCHTKVTTESEIQEHILATHLNALKCQLCVASFVTFDHLRSHLECHAMSPCDICGKPFNEKKKMIRHRGTHMTRKERSEFEKSQKMKSRVEKRDFLRTGDNSAWKRKILWRVIRGQYENESSGLDIDLNPFKKYPLIYTPETGKLAISGVEILFNVSKKMLDCSRCDMKFSNGEIPAEIRMQNHILGRHLDAFKCSQASCDSLTFGDLEPFKAHLMEAHKIDIGNNNQGDHHDPTELEDPVTLKVTKNVKVAGICHICGKILKNKHCLPKHLWTHMSHHEKEEYLATKKKPGFIRNERDRSKFKFQCNTCSKKFPCLWELQVHEVTHQRPEERRYEVCPTCGKRYGSMMLLQQHQRNVCAYNTKEVERLKCDFCEKTLKNPSQMKKHIRTQHPDKEEIVLGEKRFQCTECPQRFRREMRLREHTRKEHGHREDEEGETEDDNFECRRGCGKVLKTMQGRSVHEGNCHGDGYKTARPK